ncbi:MAG: NADPH:quinone oxidoreductase family protein [Pseudomonadota bacterium]
MVCHEYGDISQLSYESYPDPTITDNQILIKVRTAGVNFPDGLLVQGAYQVKPPLPFVPGMECSGDVIAVGKNCKQRRVGDRVMCSSPGYGAYAEQLAIDERNTIALPNNVPYEDAANLLVAHGTAHHALQQRANLQADETLVVLGAAGGTGLAAVQIGKAMGARVIAAASSDEKLQLAADNGADILINYSNANIKDSIKQHTGGAANVIYDPVGGELFDASIRAMARNGRYLVIGFASGVIPKLPVNLALVKEFSLVGVFWGTFVQKEPQAFGANMETLFQWYNDGKINVSTDKTFPLSQSVEALGTVMNRQVRGKVCIKIQ